MRRRLRRRPAPPKAPTPKSTTRKPSGHRLGGLRVVPLGKTGDAWLRTESGIRPCSYRGWVGGTLYPSSAPAGAPAAPGRSASPCFAAESARVGTLMSLPEGIATPAVRGTRFGASGGAVSSVVTSGCPKRSEGGFPVGTRTVTSASSAQQEEICGAPPLLSEGRNEGEHRGNHDGGSAGCARHGLDLLIPGRWGRRRCSGCPGRAQRRGRSSCCPVGGL